MSDTKWVSYPTILANSAIYWLWRNTMCRLDIHLWDQVRTGRWNYLYCDACELNFDESGAWVYPDEYTDEREQRDSDAS